MSESSKRILPVAPSLLTLLRQHWRNQQEERLLLGVEWKEHGLIFASEVGTPKSPRNLEREWYRFREASGLPNTINFHLLRHSVASWLDEVGATEAVVAAVLGHATQSVTHH